MTILLSILLFMLLSASSIYISISLSVYLYICTYSISISMSIYAAVCLYLSFPSCLLYNNNKYTFTSILMFICNYLYLSILEYMYDICMYIL